MQQVKERTTQVGRCEDDGGQPPHRELADFALNAVEQAASVLDIERNDDIAVGNARGAAQQLLGPQVQGDGADDAALVDGSLGDVPVQASADLLDQEANLFPLRCGIMPHPLIHDHGRVRPMTADRSAPQGRSETVDGGVDGLVHRRRAGMASPAPSGHRHESLERGPSATLELRHGTANAKRLACPRERRTTRLVVGLDAADQSDGIALTKGQLFGQDDEGDAGMEIGCVAGPMEIDEDGVGSLAEAPVLGALQRQLGANRRHAKDELDRVAQSERVTLLECLLKGDHDARVVEESGVGDVLSVLQVVPRQRTGDGADGDGVAIEAPHRLTDDGSPIDGPTHGGLKEATPQAGSSNGGEGVSDASEVWPEVPLLPGFMQQAPAEGIARLEATGHDVGLDAAVRGELDAFHLDAIGTWSLRPR